MKDNNKRILFSGFWLAIGLVLLIAGLMEWVDSFWSGMGGGLVGVGIVQMMRWTRYRRDADYREQLDVETHDERNQYISKCAWASAAYGLILVGAAAIVIFKMLGCEQMMLGVSLSIGILMVLYWISFFILRAKH